MLQFNIQTTSRTNFSTPRCFSYLPLLLEGMGKNIFLDLCFLSPLLDKHLYTTVYLNFERPKMQEQAMPVEAINHEIPQMDVGQVDLRLGATASAPARPPRRGPSTRSSDGTTSTGPPERAARSGCWIGLR